MDEEPIGEVIKTLGPAIMKQAVTTGGIAGKLAGGRAASNKKYVFWGQLCQRNYNVKLFLHATLTYCL